ncbi:MAG: HAD-IC family P-type ATPase [Oceanospirillaceae bacterium]|nr:HAD-IC family P-type ATPase [Oceanospirillaceae bacterium]
MEELGLTRTEALARLEQFGPNELPQRAEQSLISIALSQFKSPFIYVLLAASVVSLALGQTVNALFIFFVLLLNALIGTIQEHSAEKSAAALRKMVPQFANVIRDGINLRVEVNQLVPGDLVMLVSGDRVGADMQLVRCLDLLVDESLLTGESVAAEKSAKAPEQPTESLAEQRDRLFAGTIVTHGRAYGEVTATGLQTQLGQIAEGITQEQTAKPPLIKRIEAFTLRISVAVLIVIALLFIVTLSRGEPLAQVFLMGVALAVSAIPEGLPAAITVALAIGMRRMAKAQVIVRRLIAVESLGSCTYIASDKTGTLTVNELTVREIWLSNESRYRVTGEGLDEHGEIESLDANSDENEQLRALIECASLTNEAEYRQVEGERIANGDGVDLAFLVLAAKFGIEQVELHHRHAEVQSIPYESERGFSASLNQYPSGPRLMVKGSLEHVLAMCQASEAEQLEIQQQLIEMASRGLRVLACASVAAQADVDIEEQLNGLEFLGLVGMIDPLRPESADAVAQCRAAHIEVAMITGDHPQTALAIARELKIADQTSEAVTGSQIAAAIVQVESGDSGALSRLIASTRVFARIEPTQKLQIVQQLIDDGEFVAVTGDGVNDAPALHNAHVGIAMGKRGTDVARESSDLIITDDNFASIVEGIKQGRIVYNNIRKVIFLLISTGAAEIFLFILSVLFGLPIPLFPIQLLWLNLVTNGIQDVALAFEPAEGDELQRRPRPPKEPIFNRLMVERVLINAFVMGGLAFLVFAWQIENGVSVESARNITLLLMVLFENVHVLNSRSETRSLFRISLLSNPLLIFGMLAAQSIHIIAMQTPGISTLLDLEPVSFATWGTLLSIALVLIVVDELHKLVKHR